MDTVRYVLTLIIVATLPAAFAIWPLLHGYVRFWRRVGPRWTYVTLGALAFVLAGAIFAIRGPLLRIDFGFNPWLTALAVPTYGVAAVIEIRCRRHLSFRTLVGMPELAPSREKQELLHEGIYASVRHPRYLGFIVGVLAFSLFCNYLILYVFFPFFVLAIYWITVLEERELLERFGDAEYRGRVPRLVPRLDR